MMPRRLRRNSKDAGIGTALTVEEVIRVSREINFRVKRDRLVASSAARENYLRGLLGLPPTPSLYREDDAR